MRYIIISLILLNVLLLLWQRKEPEPGAVPVVKTPTRAEIQLLDEAAAASEAELAAVVDTKPARAGAARMDATPAAPLPDKSPQMAAIPVIAAETGSAAELPAMVGDSAISCRASPWTAQSREGELWHELLQARSWRVEERSAELAPSYLVYIPAKASKEASLARLRELKALSIDSAFLNQGEQAGGISLGLFSKPESATKRLQQVLALGINDALTLERKKNRQEWRFHAGSSHWPEALLGWQEEKCEDQATQNLAAGAPPQ